MSEADDQPRDELSAAPAEQSVGERRPHRGSELIHKIEDAAIEAELATGVREETEEKAKAHIGLRLARITVGFLVVIVGIVLLPLPGPGWVIIAGGFVILSQDFVWAERTVRLIRRRVPGVPEDGKIPRNSWIMIVLVTVGAGLTAFFFGDDLTSYLGQAWSSVF